MSKRKERGDKSTDKLLLNMHPLFIMKHIFIQVHLSHTDPTENFTVLIFRENRFGIQIIQFYSNPVSLIISKY